MAFTPAPGNHVPWVQQRKTRSRPRATTSPPPVFDISSRNRFAPLCETDRDACGHRRLNRRHVRATLAEGKVHTHCLPGARVLDVSCRYPRSWRMTRALQLLWFMRGLTTPGCGRRRHWRGTSGAWSRRYAAHRQRRRSSCQDLFPTYRRGHERFSRLFALNEWLFSWCTEQKILLSIIGIFSGSVLGYFVLMACTPAESVRNSCRTTSPGRYAPSD